MRLESFTCFDIEIPKHLNTLPTVYDCLESEMAEELITEGWSCGDCGIVNGALKKETTIHRAPRFLIIQLKRFILSDRGFIKDSSEVRIPTENFRFGGKEYKLVGMVNHKGTKDFGHYVLQ